MYLVTGISRRILSAETVVEKRHDWIPWRVADAMNTASAGPVWPLAYRRCDHQRCRTLFDRHPSIIGRRWSRMSVCTNWRGIKRVMPASSCLATPTIWCSGRTSTTTANRSCRSHAFRSPSTSRRAKALGPGSTCARARCWCFARSASRPSHGRNPYPASARDVRARTRRSGIDHRRPRSRSRRRRSRRLRCHPSGTQFARFSVGVVGCERPLGQGGGALVGDRDRQLAAEGGAPTVVAALDS
jgi:hypothetical protein